MKCVVCHEPRPSFVCHDCNHRAWHPRRRHLLHTLHHNTALQQQIDTRLTQRAREEHREQERSQHRKRLDEIQQLLTVEQSKVDRLRAINRARRTLLAHRQSVVVKADSLLHNELHKLIHQPLPDRLSLLDSRLQRSIKAVRDQQKALLSLLFKVLCFRRLTSSSLSLVGVLPDDLEVEVAEYEPHATALGYLVRVVQLAATYLQVHLPFAMYFHPTFAALSSSSTLPFSSTASAYPPLSASPSASTSASSLSSAAGCYVLSPIGWDGRATSDEYRRGLALLAHNVVFLCRAAGRSDSVRLWRLGGNLLDLLLAVTLGLHERNRQEAVNDKAARDELWARQRDREEREKVDEWSGETDEPTGEADRTLLVHGGQQLADRLASGTSAGVAEGGKDGRGVRFAAIAVANLNADDAEWDLVETEQLDEWDEKDEKHSTWNNGYTAVD